MSPISMAPPYQANAPAEKARQSDPAFVSRGAMRPPIQPRYLPIHTTGCQRPDGSPNARSSQKANSKAMTAVQPGRFMRSILDAALRRHTGIERVLDLLHLGHRVGKLDDLRRAAPARDDDVYLLGTAFQGLQHVIQRQPAVDQGIGELVQHDQEVLASQDGGLGLVPAFPGKLARVFQVL